MNFISFSRPGVVFIFPPPHLSNQALSDLLWVWTSTSTVLVIVRLKTVHLLNTSQPQTYKKVQMYSPGSSKL